MFFVVVVVDINNLREGEGEENKMRSLMRSLETETREEKKKEKNAFY